jgi:hypothetical protein
MTTLPVTSAPVTSGMHRPPFPLCLALREQCGWCKPRAGRRAVAAAYCYAQNEML